MFYISEFRIEGFWGRYLAEARLNKDVNIFVGRNGTGKTTLINILQAVLEVDTRLLRTLEFTTVTLKLRDANRRRTIKVTKQDNPELPYEVVVFHVANRRYTLYLSSRGIDSRRALGGRQSRRIVYEELRHEMDNLVNLTSISVHRETRRIDAEEESGWRSDPDVAPIDVRLKQLVQDLTQYRLSLAQQANAVADRFQNDVLASILYKKEFDELNFEEVRSVDTGNLKEHLIRTYDELGVLSPDIERRINDHIEAIQLSITALKDAQSGESHLRIEDFMPFPLLRRTQYMTDLSTEAEKSKQEIFNPINRFFDAVQAFFINKTMKIGDNEQVGISTAENETISIEQLSSGEKQILVFLTETLLQQGEFYIFIADEPELSLHVEWQAQIVPSLKQLNRNSQVILATHSPEIAAGYADHIIDMEDVIS